MTSNVFTTREEIRREILKIRSIDYTERDDVLEKFYKELDNGGVTREEIRRIVRELREDQEISEIDKKNLLKLL